MVGANISFVVTKVDREAGFAIASRALALRSQRYFFSHRPALNAEGARLKCRILSVGPRRCLVECYGHDVGLTQRELSYNAIPDLREEFLPGDELDCMVKSYDVRSDKLTITVKELNPNPFDGAELRHPIGCRRQAVIAGKYGGGVFCNLPDGTVCMCLYSYQYEDSDFQIGDTVIIGIQRYDSAKKQIYGKIIAKR
jgi:ribosomal protein S1